MENDNQKTVMNKDLPFEPICPHCRRPVDIEKDAAGYYVLCKWCGNEWAASKLDPENEIEWLEKFHLDKCISTPVQSDKQKPDPSPTKVLMEIAHSSETLKKAYEMVSEAYKLVNSDPVARKYIHFHSEVTWHKFVWDILMEQYNKDNPLSDDIYHLRAFDYYGIQPGMYVTDGCVDGQG